LAAGDSKVITGCIPASSIENYYTIQLINNKDKVVQSEMVNVITDRAERVWLGVMSDSSRTIDEVSRNYNSYAVQMKLDRLVDVKADRIDAINNINVLIINDFDMNSLAPEQLDKIGRWVQDGGILVMGSENAANESWFDTVTGGTYMESVPRPYTGSSAYSGSYNGGSIYTQPDIYNNGIVQYGKLNNPMANALHNSGVSDPAELVEELAYVFQSYYYDSGTDDFIYALQEAQPEYAIKLLSVLTYMNEDGNYDSFNSLITEVESYYGQPNCGGAVDRIAKLQYDYSYGDVNFESYDLWTMFRNMQSGYVDGSNNGIDSAFAANINAKMYVCGSGEVYTVAPAELSEQLLALNIDPSAKAANSSYRSSYDYYSLDRPGDFLGGFFLAIIMLYAIFIGPILYFILKKRDKKDKAVKIIPGSALCLTGIIIVCSLGSNFQRPMSSVINIVNASSGGVKALNGNAICSAPVMNEVHIKNDKIQNVHMEKRSSWSGSDSRAYKISLDSFDYTVYNANKWDTNHFVFTDTIELNGALDVHIDSYDTANSTMTVTITNNTGYDLQDLCACGRGYNAEYLVAKKLNNGESITVTQDFENSNYSYSRRTLTDESRKFQSLSANKKKAAEISNDCAIKVTGFVKTDIAGDFKINGRKASKKEVSAFSNMVYDNDNTGMDPDDILFDAINQIADTK
ncbi:MAG: hypothetical protein IJR45_02925, partial [Firmicutes bacterium]|nr:hypothetical protein [Bacillota bacterium]